MGESHIRHLICTSFLPQISEKSLELASVHSAKLPILTPFYHYLCVKPLAV